METSEAKKIVDYKDKKITAQREAKEESILISSSVRDGAMIANTLLVNKKITPEQIKETFEKWQKYFYDYADKLYPVPFQCPTCGMVMKKSQKGEWYCSGYYDKSNLKHHPSKTPTPNEEKFLSELDKTTETFGDHLEEIKRE